MIWHKISRKGWYAIEYAQLKLNQENIYENQIFTIAMQVNLLFHNANALIYIYIYIYIYLYIYIGIYEYNCML